MNLNGYYANISSRLGLRFAPIGSNVLNKGVEKGGREILNAIRPSDLNGDVPQFEVKFKAPELIENDSYLSDVLDLYSEASTLLTKEWDGEKSLIALGGDHSIAYISLSAVLEAYGEQNVAVIMFDSHADLHLPETSPTGNFHGMWLRPFFDGFSQFALRNKKILPEQLQFVGNLLLEDEEKKFLTEKKVIVYSSSDISETTISKLLSWATQFPHLHISFDIDVFSKSLVAATGTPNPNGFKEEEIFPILKKLRIHPSISLDIVEYNPQKDGFGETMKIIKNVYNAIF